MRGAHAHRSSSRPFATTAAAAAAIFGLVLAVLAPSSWRTVLRSTGWHSLDDGGSTLIQTIATEEEVQAAFPVPEILTNSNQPLTVYPGKTRSVLADCQIRGPGVQRPSVAGRRSYLLVTKPRGFDDDGLPVELDEDGQAAWEAAEYAYATFENDEGVFGAWSERLKGTVDDEFRVEFWPTRPGTFKLSVDLLSKGAMWPIHHRRGDTIEVLPPEDENSPIKKDNHQPVNRCSGLPDTRGVWYKCATAPGLPLRSECLRWGYTFRPNHGRCYYEAWTARDLVAYATNATLPKRWILVAGTSRARGVFLALADHLLAGRRGEFAAIAKCWGRMEVEVGSLRLTFQDYRAQDILGEWPLSGTTKRFQCHNDKQATYDDSDYARNATLFMQHVFDARRKNGGDGRAPTHLVFEYIEDQNPALYRDLIFSSMPADWQGAATGIFFRSLVTGGSMDAPALDPDERAEWIETATEGRTNVPVDLVDTLEIIRPWLRMSEFGVQRGSQHWHSCTKPLPNDNNGSDAATTTRRGSELLPTLKPIHFAVQGLVTDQLAQMVYNRALGPRPPREVTAAMQPAGEGDSKPNRPGLRVCMDCPPQLLPFNVKPEAELTCHAEIPVSEFKSHYVPVLPECPAWCMARPVDSVADTQSGQVEVRDCKAKEETTATAEAPQQEEEGEEDAPLL